MKVITLDRELFADHCRALERLSADFHPDLIITIASGGDYVGEYIYPAVPHMSVSLHRPSTKAKRPWLMSLVRSLPLWLRNVMRVAESHLLSRLPHDPLPALKLPENIARAVAASKHILVVDDAVDSGATLAAVLSAISALPGERAIASAAITVTTASPLATPTYYIYNDKILIRFPWSSDN